MNGFAPHAEYHADIDIFHVQFSDAEIARTSELDLWRNVDLAADGEPVAVEFVNASMGLNLRDVPRSAEVADLARPFGLPLVV